jgi:TP901 family phage tail tape measure protein
MASNNLKNEDLVLNIIVNGNSAQSEIGRLSRAMVDNKNKLKAAQSEMQLLERQGQTNSARYRQLQQDVTRYNQLLDAYRDRLAQVRQSLRLEDQTIGDLEKTLRRLQTLRRQATPGSETFNRLTQQMAAVSARLAELRGQAQSTGGILASMQNQLKSYFNSWVSGALALGTAVAGIRKATEDFAKFDDKLSDVMKTTNLNKDSVIGLNKELENIQTRTSQEDLLGLARISGKLGYTEINDIVEFVRANNQLVVALNEDLGGNVEETVNAVGKLVDIFKLKDTLSTEQAFLKVGSAINELGMASTANEGYIVDFTKRLSGIAPLTGMTIQQVMGLGATLDALGQSEEVSSTALSKLFIKMASNADVYSKYAGLQLTEFKDLLEKDFMSAFIRVMEGVKKNSNGINELAATLGDLGEDGGRTIGVIGKLSENTEMLRAQINLSNQAYANGTSLTQEYNVKNENAAAKLEMARKEVAKYWRELGEKLFPVLTSGVNLTTMFIRVLGTLITFLVNHIGVISSLTVAVVAYYTAVKIQTQWDTIATAVKGTLRVVTLALSMAYNILTGNTMRAQAAQRLLNIEMALNPYGVVAVAIVALTAMMVKMVNSIYDAKEAQKVVNDEMQRARELSDNLKASTQELSSAINDSSLTRYAQSKAFVELQKLYPELLENMSLEEFQAKGAAQSLFELNKAREEQEKALIRTNYDQAIKDQKRLKEEYTALSETMRANKNEVMPSRLIRLLNQLTLAEERVKEYGKKVADLDKAEFGAKPLIEQLGYYNKLRDAIKRQIDEMEKQDALIKQMTRGWDSFQARVNSIRLDSLYLQLKDVGKKIDSLTPNKAESIEKEIKTVGDRRAYLEKKLQELKAAFETLNEKDIAGRKKNLAERKRIQTQLDALDMKESTGGSSSSAADKAARAANKARLRELEAEKKNYQDRQIAAGVFQKNIKSMTQDERNELLRLETEHQEKMNAINKKYNHSYQETAKKSTQELIDEANKEFNYLKKLVDKTDPLIQQENEAYEQRMKDAGLFGVQREKMTEEQLRAMEILENNHQRNINKIDADAIDKRTDEILAANKSFITDLRIQHSKELSQITTLAQAKEALSTKLTVKELNRVTNLRQAKRLISNEQELEEQKALRKHLDDLLAILNNTMKSGKMEGIDLSDELLSEEEKEKLKKRIQELNEEISKLKGVDQTENLKTDDRAKTDILGMKIEDWESLFKNVDTTAEGLQRIYGAVGGLVQVWGQYNALVAAGENAQLQKDEQANKKKKSNLDQRLKAGTITQEAYNAQIEKLDKDMEHKKSVVAHNQAKRERNVALMSAIVNTASAVTKALPNIFLAALVGAMGGLQVATILKTPLPAIEGKEDGGYLDVTRSQDGQQFRAKNNPDQRGYVNSPTVIVGEDGTEFVANNQAVRNPHIRPIIDILDRAQRNGTISSLKMNDIIRTTMSGRATGGYVSNSTSTPSTTIIQSGSNEEIIALITEGNRINAALHEVLKNGVSVALLGPNGFNAKQAELQRIQNNADL